MKRLTFSLVITLSLILNNYSQYYPIIQDDFSDNSKFYDLSVLVTLDGETGPVSAFDLAPRADDNTLSYNAIQLTSDAVGKGGYNGYYYTHTSIDYEIPEFDRTSYEDFALQIDFDLIWHEDAAGKSGQSGKLQMFAIHEYPEGGPEEGDISQPNDHPYGRPAYQCWIMDGYLGAMLAFGGGDDPLGTFNFYNNATWLPGFSGPLPEGYSALADETGQPEFPDPMSTWLKTEINAETYSTTQWKHYTWRFSFEKQELFIRNSSEGPESDSLFLFMITPENPENVDLVNEAHGSVISAMPDVYQWIETISAFRFYWRSGQNFSLANVKISNSGDPLTTYTGFKRDKVVARESDGKASLEIEIINESSDSVTTCDLVLVNGDAALIDNYETQTISFPAGSADEALVNLTVTGDENAENDTLIFELQNASGGDNAVVGPDNTLMLIIRDESTGIVENQSECLQIYPNPGLEFIRVRFENENIPRVNYQIYTFSGSVLQEGTTGSDGIIFVNELKNGIYLLKVITDKKSVISRFNVFR